MRVLYRRSLLIILCCFFASNAEEAQGLKTRIGIFNPKVSGGGKKFAKEIIENLKKSLSEMGGYDIYTQDAMEEAFANIERRFPKYCREPRCVSAVGSAMELDRMLYGSVEKGEKTYGVRFTLVDVASKQIIEKVNIESNPGVGLADMIRVTVSKLHGHVDEDLDTNIHTYYGKQFHNMKQLYISAGSCIALGLLWTLVNGTTVEGNTVVADYSEWTKAECGIGTGADLIPLFARPGALGNCYIAASDDAYGVFFNPAGLSWASGGEVSFGYQYRFGLNNFAASYTNKATREIGFGQGFLYSGDNEDLFSEVYFISAISYKFNELISFSRPFSIGASVKIISKKTGDSNISPSSISGSASGAGLNFGIQLEFSEKIRGGIFLRNAPSIIRWNNVSTGRKYNESEPVELLMGGSFQANYATFLICEGHIPLYKEQVWKGACGVERIIFRVMRIRLGIEKAEGLTTPWKINGGFGVNIFTESFLGKYFILDSSYEYNTLLPFSNVLNFSFRFGF